MNQAELLVQQRKERTAYWLLLATGFFAGVSCTVFAGIFLTEFLMCYTMKELPLLLCFSGIITAVFSFIYHRLQRVISYQALSTLMFFLLLGCYSSFIVAYLLNITELQSTIIKLGFIFIIPSYLFTYLIFRGYFERIFDDVKIQQLTAEIGTGWRVGSLGSFILFLQLNGYNYSIIQLLILSTASFFIFVSLALVTGSLFNQTKRLQENNVYIRAKNPIRLLIRNKYFILVALATFMSISVGLQIEFLFLEQVQIFGMSSVDNLHFLGTIGGVALGIGILLQFSFGVWLAENNPVQKILLILPFIVVVLIGIALTFGFVLGFDPETSIYTMYALGIFFMYGTFYCMNEIISRPTLKTFITPIEIKLRYDIASKLNGVVTAFSIIITAGIIYNVQKFKPELNMILPQSLATSDYSAVLLFFTLLTTVVWLIAIVKLKKIHLTKIKENLGTPQSSKNKAKRVPTISEILLSKIEKEKDYILLSRQLSLLQVTNPLLYQEALDYLLESDDIRIRARVLNQIRDLNILDCIATLDRILVSKYFPTLPDAEKIIDVYHHLKNTKNRLKGSYVDHLSFSKHAEERLFGAYLIPHTSLEVKQRLLGRLLRDSNYGVRKQAIVAAKGVESPGLQKDVIRMLNDKKLSNTALASIVASEDAFLDSMEVMFYEPEQKLRVQKRILQAYAQIASDRAVELLWKKLDYPNQNIVSFTFQVLSQCGVSVIDEYRGHVEKAIEEVCELLIWNITASLAIPDNNENKLTLEAIRLEIQQNYRNIFDYLSLLCDPQTIRLIQKNIDSPSSDEASFAVSLLELTIPASLPVKPWVNKLLSKMPDEDKVKEANKFWPIPVLDEHEAIKLLVQREYHWVNIWTKACALNRLASFNKTENQPLLVANLSNPSKLIAEMAALSLKEQSDELFEKYKGELHLSESLLPNGNNETTVSEGLSLYKSILLFNTISEFAKIPGVTLAEFTKISRQLNLNAGEVLETFEYTQDFPFIIVAKGELSVFVDGEKTHTYNESTMIQPLDHYTVDTANIEIQATKESSVIILEQDELYYLLTSYDDIVHSMS